MSGGPLQSSLNRLRARGRQAALMLLPLLLVACTTTLLTRDHAGPALDAYEGAPAPATPREFRAAWVATVANIDWPSKPGLPVAQQQAEMVKILDSAQALGLNAIILQVRPSADAMYPSALEPWSEYLTGTQGLAPVPAYDPLAQWIELAHARGMELHAWINPYRARHFSATSPLHESHISSTQPQAVKSYGAMLWMDPAEPAARQRTLDVVGDIVHRYEVDGIHIDDYFYPYPTVARLVGADGSETFEDVEFPDEPAWQKYRSAGGIASRADWRRTQVNQLIEAMYARVHAEKPWVRFGISPFGLGKPQRRAPGISGFSQYDAIYADAELWLANGWLDYLAPQLYWPIDQPAQAFATLLESWARENTQGRHLWPGLFTSRIDDSPRSWQAQEIVRQVELTRQNPGTSGHIHFSMVALLQDRRGVATQLKEQSYSQAALVPATGWLTSPAASVPQPVRITPAGPNELRVHADGAENLQWLAVWRKFGTQWRFSVQSIGNRIVDIGAHPQWGQVQAVAISAVSRTGVEGARNYRSIPPLQK